MDLQEVLVIENNNNTITQDNMKNDVTRSNHVKQLKGKCGVINEAFDLDEQLPTVTTDSTSTTLTGSAGLRLKCDERLQTIEIIQKEQLEKLSKLEQEHNMNSYPARPRTSSQSNVKRRLLMRTTSQNSIASRGKAGGSGSVIRYNLERPIQRMNTSPHLVTKTGGYLAKKVHTSVDLSRAVHPYSRSQSYQTSRDPNGKPALSRTDSKILPHLDSTGSKQRHPTISNLPLQIGSTSSRGRTGHSYSSSGSEASVEPRMSTVSGKSALARALSTGSHMSSPSLTTPSCYHCLHSPVSPVISWSPYILPKNEENYRKLHHSGKDHGRHHFNESPEDSEGLVWRRLHMSKAKLKATATTSELLSGFAMVAMVELQINEPTNVPEWLFIMFAICTTVLVAVHIFALMISTYLLPNIEAISKLQSTKLVSESPHERMRGFVEIAWAFSTVLGLFLFLVEVAILCWVKFWDYSLRAAIAATIIVIPVLIIFIVFVIHFYHSVIKYKCQTSNSDMRELEDIKRKLDAGHVV
ncbi:hypothetical protein WDU94_010022 [Cyamophila willieti]